MDIGIHHCPCVECDLQLHLRIDHLTLPLWISCTALPAPTQHSAASHACSFRLAYIAIYPFLPSSCTRRGEALQFVTTNELALLSPLMPSQDHVLKIPKILPTLLLNRLDKHYISHAIKFLFYLTILRICVLLT